MWSEGLVGMIKMMTIMSRNEDECHNKLEKLTHIILLVIAFKP